jgi:hypothetical protein
MSADGYVHGASDLGIGASVNKAADSAFSVEVNTWNTKPIAAPRKRTRSPGSIPCDNSDSGVLGVQSADQRVRNDAPDWLNEHDTLTARRGKGP